jgi:hypothetical protein
MDFFEILLQNDPQPFPADQCAADSVTLNIEHLSRVVTQTIANSDCARNITTAMALNIKEIENRVAKCIRMGIPFYSQILWSPKKHWVKGAESGIDLAELVALKTLFDIHVAVRSIYAPGLNFTLHLEDIEFEFMEGNDPLLSYSRDHYIDGLQSMIRVLGLQDVFAVSRMSCKAKDEGELNRWIAQMQDNFKALNAYWYESEKNGIAGYENYESFKVLRRLGWNGPIPQEMRNHYLKRINCRQAISHRETVSMVLRNFAGILLHYQENLLRTASDVEPIKFSFVPPAPGAPVELMTGRIDLRFVPRKVCSHVNAAGPWSTKGYFRERKGKILPAFKGWLSPLPPDSKFVEGHLILSRDDETVNVRADFLQKETW